MVTDGRERVGGVGGAGGGCGLQGGQRSAAQPEGLTKLVGTRAELASWSWAVAGGQGPAEPQLNPGY